MKQLRALIVAASAAVLSCAGLLPVASASAAGMARTAIRGAPQRTAIEVPGIGALNKGGNAGISSMSCTSAGDCAAGGYYTDRSGNQQAFVVSERDGLWRPAIEVPGTGRLNKGGNADIAPVSCTATGSCTAGGEYRDRTGHYQAFVVSERDGLWRPAIEVPGTGRLNKGGNAQIASISCASAGDCSAGGWYTGGSGHQQAFVASERHGLWRPAIEVPGTGTLNRGGFARVDSVSCASSGNCAAGGSYRDGSGGRQAFIAVTSDGRWHTAIEVPHSGALNEGGNAEVFDLSCPSAGNCVAGGWYLDSSGTHQAFVADESNGTWHRAIELPGSGRLNRDDAAWIASISCVSAGNCEAGGAYMDGSGNQQALVASERHGAWRRATEVPGVGALNKGGDAEVNSVSCASASSCAANGSYLNSSGGQQVFVAG
jgi:hypothetical protein